MRKLNIGYLVGGLMLILVFTACEEVIEIDLNSSSPLIVAEGMIEQDSVAWLKLSYTRDYFDVEESEHIEDFVVSLKDEAGNEEELEHVGNGLYKGSSITGQTGMEYTLSFSGDEDERTATSILNAPVTLFAVDLNENEMPRPGEEDTYRAKLKLGTQSNSNEYQLVKFWVNGVEDQQAYYLINGEYYTNADTTTYIPMQLLLEKGDELKTIIYSIDRETYVYYSQLNERKGNGMMGSSTPYNPKSNFGEGVMGYFTARSSIERQTTVK